MFQSPAIEEAPCPTEAEGAPCRPIEVEEVPSLADSVVVVAAPRAAVTGYMKEAAAALTTEEGEPLIAMVAIAETAALEERQ